MPTTVISSTQNPLTLEQIWDEYRATRNVHLLDLLTVHYLPLVPPVALRVAARLPRLVETEDLLQDGALGLRRGIELFDPERSTVFEMYAAFHIRGAIIDGLRHRDWRPRLVLARTRLMEEAARTLEMRTGRKPTEEELAAEMKLSGKSLKAVVKDAPRVAMVSLSTANVRGDSRKSIALGETLADVRAVDPALQAQASDLRDFIQRGLTRGERLILMLYYYENMTMYEIGLTLDLSESRVSQIHKVLVHRLKARMANKRMEYLPQAG